MELKLNMLVGRHLPKAAIIPHLPTRPFENWGGVVTITSKYRVQKVSGDVVAGKTNTQEAQAR